MASGDGKKALARALAVRSIGSVLMSASTRSEIPDAETFRNLINAELPDMPESVRTECYALLDAFTEGMEEESGIARLCTRCWLYEYRGDPPCSVCRTVYGVDDSVMVRELWRRVWFRLYGHWGPHWIRYCDCCDLVSVRWKAGCECHVGTHSALSHMGFIRMVAKIVSQWRRR